MAPAVNIKSFERVIPMIYAYTHPNYPPHQGWTKIGYTDKQSVEERVRQQNHTAGIDYKILWRDNAMYKDGSGEYFMDHDFHRYLTRYRNVERDKGREWFISMARHHKACSLILPTARSRFPTQPATTFCAVSRQKPSE